MAWLDTKYFQLTRAGKLEYIEQIQRGLIAGGKPPNIDLEREKSKLLKGLFQPILTFSQGNCKAKRRLDFTTPTEGSNENQENVSKRLRSKL